MQTILSFGMGVESSAIMWNMKVKFLGTKKYSAVQTCGIPAPSLERSGEAGVGPSQCNLPCGPSLLG